jgi:GTP pyrophosphokinase
MVPLRYKLHSGDIVEILTQAGHQPSRDWLGIVKSSRSRQKIKHWLNIHQRVGAIEIGRKLIEKEARKYRVSIKDIKEADFQRLAQEYGCARPEDLMAGIGYGKFSARQLLGRLAPASAESTTATESEVPPGGLTSVVRRVFGASNANAIKVTGNDDLLVYRARCCNPIRGEEILGYVTRGKGVAVHAKNCPNVLNLVNEAERRIAVEWTQEAKDGDGQGFPVKLTLLCDDVPGMLKHITTVISDDNINIRNIEARTSNHQANVDVVVDVEHLKRLEHVVSGLKKIQGVRDVQRVQKL